MHTVTFYSFKGHVVAELVRKGCRVLVVDFDLEASVLTHSGSPGPRSIKSGGVVDFVHRY